MHECCCLSRLISLFHPFLLFLRKKTLKCLQQHQIHRFRQEHRMWITTPQLTDTFIDCNHLMGTGWVVQVISSCLLIEPCKILIRLKVNFLTSLPVSISLSLFSLCPDSMTLMNTFLPIYHVGSFRYVCQSINLPMYLSLYLSLSILTGMCIFSMYDISLSSAAVWPG